MLQNNFMMRNGISVLEVSEEKAGICGACRYPVGRYAAGRFHL